MGGGGRVKATIYVISVAPVTSICGLNVRETGSVLCRIAPWDYLGTPLPRLLVLAKLGGDWVSVYYP